MHTAWKRAQNREQWRQTVKKLYASARGLFVMTTGVWSRNNQLNFGTDPAFGLRIQNHFLISKKCEIEHFFYIFQSWWKFERYVPRHCSRFCARFQAVFSFLSRVRTLTRDIDIAILSVCLSVRPSVRPSVRDTLVLYENGLTYRHSFFTVR